jgi:hypothetical protein
MSKLSFYVTKTFLVGPKWFWSDQIDLDLPIMISSWPKWNCRNQNEFVMSNCDFLEFPKNISRISQIRRNKLGSRVDANKVLYEA